MKNNRTSKIIGITIVTMCIFIWGHDIYSQVQSEELIKVAQEEKAKNEQKEKDAKLEEYKKIQKLLKENQEDLTILVNKENSLADNYQVKNLVSPNVIKIYDKIKLRSDTSDALEAMIKAAKEENLNIYLRSGYRSKAEQSMLYNISLKSNGKEYTDKYKAKPNQSEHQTGLAVDLTCDSVGKKLIPQFEDTDEGRWLAENALKYGFILRYKKDRTEDTGYAFEPWHFRYIGKEIATYIYENDLILEDLYK